MVWTYRINNVNHFDCSYNGHMKRSQGKHEGDAMETQSAGIYQHCFKGTVLRGHLILYGVKRKEARLIYEGSRLQ